MENINELKPMDLADEILEDLDKLDSIVKAIEEELKKDNKQNG